MKMPDCPDGRDDCRFRHEGGSCTAMHSPLVFDRNGNPVGGGGNAMVQSIHCVACNRRFVATGTELDFVQGKETYRSTGDAK